MTPQDRQEADAARGSRGSRLWDKFMAHAVEPMGARELYTLKTNPKNPTHENMPLISQRTVLETESDGLVPVVVANVQHPTASEMCSGAKGMCIELCRLVGVLVAVGIVLSLTGATDCVVSPTASGEAPLACQRDANLQPTSLQTDAALDPHILDKLMPECNTCSAWDGMCDESDPSAENGDGLCPPGTDAYDCIVADQTRRAIYEASSYVAPLGGMDAVFLFVGFGWFALAPVVLSCAYLCPVKKCASCKFDAIPM